MRYFSSWIAGEVDLEGGAYGRAFLVHGRVAEGDAGAFANEQLHCGPRLRSKRAFAGSNKLISCHLVLAT